jgi:hypothetical protein
VDETEWKAIIKEGTHHRGWIANSYAQLEFLLGDLVVRCREFPEYAAHTKTVSHSAAKRVAKVRHMLEIAGPLTPFAGDLHGIIVSFEQHQRLRNLLAHGFCTFLHTPDGDAGFRFRKFDRPLTGAAELDDDHVLTEQVFRLIDLEYHREQLVAQAQNALLVFAAIHGALGWSKTG